MRMCAILLHSWVEGAESRGSRKTSLRNCGAHETLIGKWWGMVGWKFINAALCSQSARAAHGLLLHAVAQAGLLVCVLLFSAAV